MSVDLGRDGETYILFSAERGVPQALFESADRSAVMERVFVEMTGAKALVVVVDRYPAVGYWRGLLRQILPEHPQVSLRQLREMHLLQEELLGRLDEGWRQRQAAVNAAEIARTVDFQLGLR